MTMEQQNHELLGLVVARQRAICAELLAKEKKTEDALIRRNAAFAATCIPELWESVKNIIVPHYTEDMSELNIPLRQYGNFIRANGMIVGVRVRHRQHACGTAVWKCKFTKDGQLKYFADFVLRDGNIEGNLSLSKQEFEQSFIEHLARVIPTDKLAHIEPSVFSERKNRRRVVAMST